MASRQTAASTIDLDYEEYARAGELFGNLDAIAVVTAWRPPDLLFDDHMELDLGGRAVHLWHFGPGNSPGDRALDRLMAYLRWLLGEVRQAMDLHLAALATVETVHLPCEFRISPLAPGAPDRSSRQDFHRLNVLATYRLLQNADQPAPVG